MRLHHNRTLATCLLFAAGLGFLRADPLLTENADTLDHATLSPATPSYSVLQSANYLEGTAAFQLANPNFTDHSVTLTPSFVPAADTQLHFLSLLRYATSSQIAKVQISANGGPWFTLHSQAGTNGPGESSFRLVSIALSDYAGQSVQIRFLYDCDGPNAYNGTSSITGWFIDDIQVGDTYDPLLYNGVGDPSALEILSVEYINRARANANAEALRLAATDDPDVLSAIDYFDVDLNEMISQFATLPTTVPPLAIHVSLTTAARLHSEDMLLNNFQGHSSSSDPPPPHLPGDAPGDRLDHQGYDWQTVGENVYAYAESVWHAHAGFNIDWGYGAYGMQVPPGHRQSIHNPSYREIGVGIVEGINGSVGPVLVTQDLATAQNRNQPLLVGVTHLDADNDAFYDPGEGIGGVTISVDGAYYRTLSSPEGAYAIPLPGDGSYSVTFQRPGYLPQSIDFTVTNGQNVKVDYRATPRIELSLLPSSSSIFQFPCDRPPSQLSAEYTTDFITWLPATGVLFQDLGDQIQMDVSPLALPFAAFRLLITP